MVASREIAQSQAFCCDNSFILKARLHAGYRSIHAVSRFQEKAAFKYELSASAAERSVFRKG